MSDRQNLNEIGYYEYAAMMGIPYFHWGGQRASDRITELLGIDGKTRVLVVGCGTGYSACRIAKNTGCDLVGVDISGDMVKGAQKRAIESGLDDHVHFQQGDAYKLEFSDAEFDVLMTEFVSVFLEKPCVFHEFARVLIPGGKLGVNELFIADEMPSEIGAKIESVLEGFEQAVGLPMKIPTMSEWKTYFADAGLDSIRQEVVDYRYKIRETATALGGTWKLLRIIGRVTWDMARNSDFRKRMMPIGRLKDVLVRDRETRDYAGAVICVGTKPI
ncbi:MAG: class I SAM-dependent methyltransferase [Candidatus Thorarchaeota archaeon]